MIEELSRFVDALWRAESEILLLARSHPSNWAGLIPRLACMWEQGATLKPALEFAPRPSMSVLRAGLEELCKGFEHLGEWGQHLAQRARELEREAQLVEHIGSKGFRERAAAHYCYSADILKQADELAATWMAVPQHLPKSDEVFSDDMTNPLCLVRQIKVRLEECGVGFPIRLSRQLAAVATVDNDSIWVRPGELLRIKDALRIAIHEVDGHAVRRAAVKMTGGRISVAGFANGEADEEGRALLLEVTRGLSDGHRRRELAVRHNAARACQMGVCFHELVEGLLSQDLGIYSALALALRIWRGGGLAREVIYLQGYCAYERAFAELPVIEEWMPRGRYSVAVARSLATGELASPLL